MSTSITGKTVLITAAAQGIGRATALAFAAAGAKVLATDINETALQSLAGGSNITARRLDVLDTAAVNAFIAEHGPFDILFNCAGFVHAGSVLEATEADFDFAVDLNVRSMMRTIKAVLPAMLEKGDGCIINMASVASSIKAVPNRFVNAICPGTVESPSLQDRMRAQGDYEEARKAFIARQPMGRLGTPEEIADLAVYLAGAPFTTGHVHIIDGGWGA
jgi:2-keto-3-deoxy-L-fuconate dehydrogenase